MCIYYHLLESDGYIYIKQSSFILGAHSLVRAEEN